MLKKVTDVLSWALMVFWVGLAVLALVFTMGARKSPDGPELFGIRAMVVLSDSMAPHIRAGDLIFAAKPDPAALKSGDIVTYRDASGQRLITHRIVQIDQMNGARAFTLKGDANNVADNRVVQDKDLVGVYRGRIPYGGYITSWARSPLGWVVLIVVPGLAMVFSELRRFVGGKPDKQ